MEVSHLTHELPSLAMHSLGAGEGEPVVLLHGWPQTSHAWRHVMPLLAPHHRLIVPDLPGLGESSAPPDGYQKQHLAGHLLELLDRLGLDRFHLVGHDWGGPTAFALACAAPQRVRTLTVLDVTVPGIGPDISQGGRRWHHAFHMTPDLPEALVQGREAAYLGWFFEAFCWQRGAIAPADVAEYVRCYSRPGALAAGFGYYRAIPDDVAANRAILASGFRLPMPVLALGGGRAEARGRSDEPLESLRLISRQVEGGTVADCGHFIPEEQPALLAARLLAFFAAA
ncbi:MAG: alpha/beta fold hydrolase [Caldimonas sp.]